MGTTLYLECTSGISGDMTVAALLDLGASEQRLREALATLPVAHVFDVQVSRVSKSGLAACDFDVRLDAGHENHDHDMAWLYGHVHGEEGAHAGADADDVADHKHEHEGHAHEHAHGHAHEHAHEHGHVLACDVKHGDEHHHEGHEHGVAGGRHDHDHDGQHHHHAHRSLADVTAIIEGSRLTERAQHLALAIFRKLAEAEAHVHGATPETVHFHEVGAVDSIVDICSVAVCLDDLDVTQVIVPSLAEGHGTIRCAHGIMPVPVPAVSALCQAAGIALAPAHVEGELVTPTGAAIVAALRTSDRLPGRYLVRACGYGAGKRSYEGCSELLRACLVEEVASEDDTAAGVAGRVGASTGGAAGAEPGKPAAPAPSAAADATGALAGTASPAAADAADGTGERPFPTEHDRTVTKLETDLDDCTGEAIGRVISLLMDAGAREAHAIPIIMKKGRPGLQLEVVCDEAQVPELERLIFENTTTIGVRCATMRRDALPRRASVAQTAYGPVATKVVTLPDGDERGYPEYDSVAEACERTGASFQEVFRAVIAAEVAQGR